MNGFILNKLKLVYKLQKWILKGSHEVISGPLQEATSTCGIARRFAVFSTTEYGAESRRQSSCNVILSLTSSVV